VLTLAFGLALPVGVAFHGGALYVSAVDRVLRFDDVESHLNDPPKPVVVTRSSSPKDRHHGWKFIAFGPDGKLYVPVGAPCNICEPNPDRYANIMRMNADGSELETFARGVRNTVGYRLGSAHAGAVVQPITAATGSATTSPPDELKPRAEGGMHFGFSLLPRRHHQPTRSSAAAAPADTSRRPRRTWAPTWQPSACASTRARSSPPLTTTRIFIAEHGSWNRSTKIGYRVSLVRLDNGKAISYEPFATGWLQGTDVWGRPADVLVMPDGSLLVSDDLAGAIYRITYRN
jgi:glucose/arabinose dehydrogenase